MYLLGLPESVVYHTIMMYHMVPYHMAPYHTWHTIQYVSEYYNLFN